VCALAEEQYKIHKAPHSLKVREENTMNRRASVLAFFLLVAMAAANQYAQAANLRVNCDRHESISKALSLLAKTNPLGPNRVIVSGGCNENLVIQSMDRLTLITEMGASITDRSERTLAVVDIENSQRVTLQGFTINGGAQGILCGTASLCYLTGNTIQGPGGFGIAMWSRTGLAVHSLTVVDKCSAAMTSSKAMGVRASNISCCLLRITQFNV
jgi:hypothetical protein